MKRLILFIWVLLLSGVTALQAQTVTGTVMDEGGERLIGATILVEGTNIGTVTDFDGKFSLEVPANAERATVSYTGFTSQSIDLTSGQSDFTVTLPYDAIGLEDVVVIGYAPTKRKDLTGSVASLDAEAITREAGSTVQSALRGAPGVVVQQSNGAPGAGFNIRVRGATSITASNEPLFVVDGVPIIAGSFAQVGVGGQQTNALADINPADIESMEVLKDASTTAIYGSRAANGVVLITTKSGAAGRTKINFNTSYGFNEIIKKVDVVDGPTYLDYLDELFGDAALLGFNREDGIDSDWQDLIFQTNPITSNNLSMSGGNNNTRFFASLGIDDNQGALNGTRFRRYSSRLNLDHTVSDKVTTGINLSYTNSNNKRIQNDNNIFGAVSTAILLPPAFPVRNEDGSFGRGFGIENPVAATTDYENRALTDRVIANARATYFPIPELALTAKLGVDMVNFRELIFEPSTLASSATGTIQESLSNNLRLVNEYTANYNNRFGTTDVNFTVGAIFQRDEIRSNFFETNDLPTNNFPSASAAATPSTVVGDLTGDILHSYISSVNLKFGGNFYLTGSFRADGSSRFINDRWGFFPGAAVGYDFAGNNQVGPFEQLKARVSYGQTGNNTIGNFVTRQLFGGGAGYLTSPGIVPTTVGNPDAVWETTTQFNVGVDMSFMKGRIGATLDYYVKNTNDLLLSRPLPGTSGFAGGVLENIGDMRNTGVEASVTLVPIQTSKVNWTMTLFGAVNRNEVVNLFNDQPIDRGFATRIAEGEPLGAFFGLQTDGIYQNQGEIDRDNALNAERDYIPGAQPGDFRFVDQNGDGTINDDDRTFIGNALPDFTGGFDNRLTVGNLDVNFFFQFNFGNEVYNNNLAFAEGLNSVFAPTVRAFEGAWRAEGDGNQFPRITGGVSADNNRQDSDRYVEDGSFVRLKSASIGYTLPNSLLNTVGIRSLRVFARGTNLITWTNYSWFDPEVNTFGDDNAALGTDFLTYPVSRTIEFGVNLGL